MKYLSKKITSVLVVSIMLLFGTSRIAFAADSECTDAKLRNLGVAVLSCKGDGNTCVSATDGSIIAQAGDGGSCNSTCNPGNTSLTGNDNPEKAFRYFVGKGLTAEQSAAIVGNMLAESGVDPQRVQNGAGPPRSPDPHASGSLGWGIIQWSPGAKVLNIAKSAGLSDKPIDDLGTQLDLVWWHLQNTTPTGAPNVLPGFKSQTTIEGAVSFFLAKVEGTTSAPGKRLTNAKGVLAKYGGSVSTASTTSAPTNCGTPGQYINGFTIYSQYDPLWKDKPYSTSTVGASGCGPSAMAMIITALTGNKVTPDLTAKYAGDIGMYVKGVGSSWDVAPRLAEKWGLKAEPIGGDLAKISSALQQGKLVITSGSGAVPFTSGGHYIVIRGISQGGKFIVGDSGHSDTSAKEWDTGPILSNLNAGSVYAISK